MDSDATITAPSAEQLLDWTDRGESWPDSLATPAFTEVPRAYQTALALRALREQRGERPRGFKIGFTNRNTKKNTYTQPKPPPKPHTAHAPNTKSKKRNPKKM